MKIIAHVGNSNVLVQVTRDEFAKMIGKTYAHELQSRGGYSAPDGFDIGAEYQVSDVYNRLRHQERVSDQLKSARENLIALAGLMACVEPVAAELTKQPEGGEA